MLCNVDFNLDALNLAVEQHAARIEDILQASLHAGGARILWLGGNMLGKAN